MVGYKIYVRKVTCLMHQGRAEVSWQLWSVMCTFKIISMEFKRFLYFVVFKWKYRKAFGNC